MASNIATDWEIPDSGPSEGELSNEETVESLSDREEEITASEPEDLHSDDSESEREHEKEAVRHTPGIQQPLKGWKEVERTASGYSKTNAGKTKQSRYYYEQKEKQKEEAKKELQQVYGDISRFFIRPPPAATSVSPLSLVIPTVVNFEQAFFRADSFAIEVQQLDIWLKAHGKEVTGAWLKRVQGVRDLLLFQGSFVYQVTVEEKRKAKWEEYSRMVAIRLEKVGNLQDISGDGKRTGSIAAHLRLAQLLVVMSKGRASSTMKVLFWQYVSISTLPCGKQIQRVSVWLSEPTS